LRRSDNSRGRRGRLLALFLLLLALAGVYLLVVAPLLDAYAELENALENRRMLIPRLDASGADVPALRDRVAELRTAASTHVVALDGASDAIASANLQSRIQELAAAAGVAIRSTESLPAEARGDYRRIGVHLMLTATYDNLLTLLGKLQTAMPPLAIDNLRIRGVLTRAGAPVANVGVGFDVYGFRTSETGDVAKP
jgi:general secretion pathway protein M